MSSDIQQDPYKKAGLLGLVVVEPGPRELLLDIDDEESLEQYNLAVEVLRTTMAAVETKRTRSVNGNLHIYVNLPDLPRPLTPIQRVALQCALGSDAKRELLAATQILHKTPHPVSVFFEVPEVDAESDVL